MTLCPACFAASIIAPKGGPTYSHRPAGFWWPEWWQTAGEERRCAWLADQNTLYAHNLIANRLNPFTHEITYEPRR